MFNRIVGILISTIMILVMLFTSGFITRDISPAPLIVPTSVPTPVGQEDIVAINPGGDSNNNAKYSPTFTLTESWNITVILTVHWNDGNGAQPGQLSLQDDNGTVYGPWQARGIAYEGVENVRWVVEPNQTLPPGKYTVVDSDPATWTNNERSEYIGFTRVAGVRMGNPENAPANEQPEVPAHEPEQPQVPVDEQPQNPADKQPNILPSNPPDVPTIPLKLVVQTAIAADGKTYED
ncbi:MAG TPA: hypothetical protein VF338_09675, partial [Leptolinea sp.]